LQPVRAPSKSSRPFPRLTSRVTVGAIVAGFGDLEFSAFGYLLGIASCLSQTGYLMYVVKREKESGMSTFGLFYANCVLSVPFVLVVAIISGDLTEALAYPDLLSPSFFAVLLLSALLGALLNYSIFLCAVVNSPLTLLVSGQFKSIVTVGVGIFTFGGVTLNFLNLSGWMLNTAGSIGYAWLKHSEKHGGAHVKLSHTSSEHVPGEKKQEV
jgi:solute carrier family 35